MDSTFSPVSLFPDYSERDGAVKVRPTPTVSIDKQVVQHTVMARYVHSMLSLLPLAPIGWCLVIFLCWDYVPHFHLALWTGAYTLMLVVNLALLRHIKNQPTLSDYHHKLLLLVPVLDGIAWSNMVLFLMGFNALLDSWLTAVLCGAIATNSPSYIYYRPAFRTFVCTIALFSGAYSLRLEHFTHLQFFVGFGTFMALMFHTMSHVALQIGKGIQFQLENAALAEQLTKTLAQVKVQARTDALTGVPNRRTLDAILKHHVQAVHNRSFLFTVLMLDIDHFKQINDVHGHGVGDEALRAFAKLVQDQLRHGDTCARYGGEEFMAVLPRTTCDDAKEIAERIREAVATQPLLDAPALSVTVSIGIAECAKAMSVRELLEQADSGVYAAKHNGRNQIWYTCAGKPHPVKLWRESA